MYMKNISNKFQYIKHTQKNFVTLWGLESDTFSQVFFNKANFNSVKEYFCF